MDDETLRTSDTGSATTGPVEIVVDGDLLEPLMGGAITGTPQTPIYEPALGAAIAFDDDGD